MPVPVALDSNPDPPATQTVEALADPANSVIGSAIGNFHRKLGTMTCPERIGAERVHFVGRQPTRTLGRLPPAASAFQARAEWKYFLLTHQVLPPEISEIPGPSDQETRVHLRKRC